jgi:hypothetical protein
MKVAFPEPNAMVIVFEYGCARGGKSIEDFVKATEFVPIHNVGCSS